ncbi:MAG: MFS transporter, partial [Acidimicrobiales bacterium]
VTCGQISDQIGRRRTLLPGLVLSAASAVVFLLDDRWSLGLAPLFAGRVLSGLSVGLFTGTATAALVDLAPESGRARASLLAAAVNMGGLGLGPVVAGVLARYVSRPLSTPFIVDLVLVALSAIGVWAVPETVDTAAGGRPRLQRLRVPDEVRPTFVRAVIAGFAGFSVLGLFTAVSPSFLGQVLHEHSPAVIGVVVFAVFGSSTAGQVLTAVVGTRPSLIAGCAGLVVGMVLIAVSLELASLAVLVAGAVVAGVSQGMSFRAGLSAVNAGSPAGQRSEVASSYFLALYVAISLPVIGVGAAAKAFGLVPSGVVFSVAVAALAFGALVSLARSG